MPILLLSRIAKLFSSTNQTMKAHHPGQDLEARTTIRMVMANLRSSTLLQHPSLRNQRPQLLPLQTLLQRRQPLANLVGRRSRPNQRLYLISAPNLLIRQLITPSRVKNSPSSASFHLETGLIPRSPMVSLAFSTAKNIPKPASSPHNRPLRPRTKARALCLLHPMQLWIRNLSSVNPQLLILLRRHQNQ